MSRNKDVKFVHEITGLPYSECRRRLKESDWDVWKAAKILDESWFYDFAEAAGNVMNAICTVFENFALSISKIDWEQVAEAFRHNLQEVDNDKTN